MNQRSLIHTQPRLNDVICYLKMLEKGLEDSKHWPPLDEPSVDRSYGTFANTHLIYTMFIEQANNGKKGDHEYRSGGYIYRSIKPHFGREKRTILFGGIKEVMEAKIGADNVSFWYYVDRHRCLLATHGNLTLYSLEEKIQNLLCKPRGIRAVNNHLDKLQFEVVALKEALEAE